MSEHQKPKQYHFFVDAKKYETEHSSLTGADIKRIAGVNPTYQLFLEEEGDNPDRAISDGEGIDLTRGAKHFYAVPPATFGA
ncbi:MAG: multiubiquitin domain-containing protein [Gammaproteobacteria bacterium]|nr:multiubiquitin domain-containing protein [Gammaproteobacteria bacterium]